MTTSGFCLLKGVDITDPAIYKELKPAFAITAALPGYKVNHSGALIGLVGLENMVERMFSNGLLGKNLEEAKRAQILATMKSPVMLQTVETKIASNWHAWVGTLVDFPNEGEVGARYSLKTESVAFGQTIPFDLTYERMAVTDPAHKGLVKINVNSRADDDAVVSAVVKFVKDIARTNGESKQKIDEIALDSAAQWTSITILTDPQTLMPRVVKTESVMDISVKGQPRKRLFEEHKCEFKWVEQ